MTVRTMRDHKQHKIAKIITADLQKIIPLMESVIGQLTNFAHYTPVKKTVTEATMNLHLLKAHLNKYKRIEEETKPK